MTHTALADAAEMRRRELPASLALTILVGGLAAAIMGGSLPVGWAAIVALILIFDCELYRRLEAAGRPLTPSLIAALAAWAGFGSAFYVVLPAALWLDGQAAGAAAAIVLWVAAAVRHFSPGVAGAWPIALAGALPAALSLLGAPLLVSAMSARPDWGLALIAAIGGGALMAYVTHARISAARAGRRVHTILSRMSHDERVGRLVLESNETGGVALLDRDGRVLAVSESIKQSLGGELEGRLFEHVTPVARERWRDVFARALAGEHVRCEEEEVRLADGRHWIAWDARPWRDEDGVIQGVFTAARDVTSLVSTRKIALGNHDLLRAALDAGKSVIWEVDYKTQTIAWYGDIAIYGEAFTFKQFIDNSTPIIHADDREMMHDYFARVAEGEDCAIEHRVLHPDGTLAWALVRARRVLGRSGGVRKFIVLSTDVTDRKIREAAFIKAMHRAESTLKAKRALFGDIAPELDEAGAAAVGLAEMHERLDALMEEMNARDVVLADTMVKLKAAREAAEAASISKSQFLASMSHELRTPLNAIIGYSEILQEEAEADGRGGDVADIQRVLTAARQLLTLINDILDLSKIEAGRMDVSAGEFDVGALIKEAAATVAPAVEKNQNTLKLEIADDIGRAFTDAFRLNQCLLNLLSNAAKFTQGGVITISAKRAARADGDWLDIAVSDTGIGLSREQADKLFADFVQASFTTARRFGGTGLGLSITRRVLAMLGGEVTLESELGKGSTFTITLPAMLAQEGQPAPAHAPAANGASRTVLLIDDEESARDLAGRALARLGFSILQASSGGQGVQMARAARPDLIVLDINLPDMTGWEVMQTLAADSACAAIPVLIHSVEDNRTRARAAGACDLLLKPADRDVLAAAALRFARAPKSSQPASRGAGQNPKAKTA